MGALDTSVGAGSAWPMVRATGVLVENDTILLVKQALRERSHWNLPGGALEVGESLGQCLVREMWEETGLNVEVGELLYVCDRFKELHHHVLDICFSVSRSSDASTLNRPRPTADERLDEVCMVPVNMLERFGYSGKFAGLVRDGFPGRGSYQGDFHEFYG